MRLEDYGYIGDLETGALVGKNGSIDWLCMPRFDSGALFAALLGNERNGRWIVGPANPEYRSKQRYRTDTLVLETEFETPDGVVRLIDFMPPTGDPELMRIVQGVQGRVRMRMELTPRFDYGSVVPWVRRLDGTVSLVAGPDALALICGSDVRCEESSAVMDFEIGAGESREFIMVWHPSHLEAPRMGTAAETLAMTEEYWREWCRPCCYEGEWEELVKRSLITLKALTYGPTGGVVAAPTTSLPEEIGGVRNWDYRYCWVRDATFTLMAFMDAGYMEEAAAWRDWLLRAVAGSPSELQIMYGPAGERRLMEYELPWLSGYENSRPVRVGNGASTQLQLDVYGELMDAMHQARCQGLDPDPYAWDVMTHFVKFLEGAWRQPDEGIWEVRGPRRHFTHSKVMAWVAFDRAIRLAEDFGQNGPVERWRKNRSELHREICERGFNKEIGSFTQYYEGEVLDGSLLMLPLVGFLPPDDERIKGTVKAIEKELLIDGFVYRYLTEGVECVDGLPPGEGAFLPCSFWLADNYVMMGRREEARELFERLVSIASPLGLIAEEYSPKEKRMVGNFPQAFSHVGLINTAHNLAEINPPVKKRPL